MEAESALKADLRPLSELVPKGAEDDMDPEKADPDSDDIRDEFHPAEEREYPDVAEVREAVDAAEDTERDCAPEEPDERDVPFEERRSAARSGCDASDMAERSSDMVCDWGGSKGIY